MNVFGSVMLCYCLCDHFIWLVIQMEQKHNECNSYKIKPEATNKATFYTVTGSLNDI